MKDSEDKTIKYTRKSIWNTLLEVELTRSDSMTLVINNLTRMGIYSFGRKKLNQSCHIFHKQKRYYIVHFKEMYIIDGNSSMLKESDIKRRNTIAWMLENWGLIKVLPKHREELKNRYHQNKIDVVKHSQVVSGEIELCPKYNIGKIKKKDLFDTDVSFE